eukprot:3808830-Rhodomonas_salina.1
MLPSVRPGARRAALSTACRVPDSRSRYTQEIWIGEGDTRRTLRRRHATGIRVGCCVGDMCSRYA